MAKTQKSRNESLSSEGVQVTSGVRTRVLRSLMEDVSWDSNAGSTRMWIYENESRTARVTAHRARPVYGDLPMPV